MILPNVDICPVCNIPYIVLKKNVMLLLRLKTEPIIYVSKEINEYATKINEIDFTTPASV